MLESKAFLSAVAVGIFGLVTATQAAPKVVMDETTHNGSFAINEEGDDIAIGGWGADDANRAQEWNSSVISGFNPWSRLATPMSHFSGNLTNNTEETVTVGEVYTVDAIAESIVDPEGSSAVYVDLLATENIDGTGTKVVLTTATLRAGTQVDNKNPSYASTSTPLIAMTTGVSKAAGAAIENYFLQVRVRGAENPASNYYWVDDITVTASIPGPDSMSLDVVDTFHTDPALPQVDSIVH